MPQVDMAEGGDQVPSALRAITSPVPILYVTIIPTFATVIIASPFACLRIDSGMDFSGFSFPIYKLHLSVESLVRSILVDPIRLIEQAANIASSKAYFNLNFC
jgi:hypothetical protein